MNLPRKGFQSSYHERSKAVIEKRENAAASTQFQSEPSHVYKSFEEFYCRLVSFTCWAATLDY